MGPTADPVRPYHVDGAQHPRATVPPDAPAGGFKSEQRGSACSVRWAENPSRRSLMSTSYLQVQKKKKKDPSDIEGSIDQPITELL